MAISLIVRVFAGVYSKCVFWWVSVGSVHNTDTHCQPNWNEWKERGKIIWRQTNRGCRRRRCRNLLLINGVNGATQTKQSRITQSPVLMLLVPDHITDIADSGDCSIHGLLGHIREKTEQSMQQIRGSRQWKWVSLPFMRRIVAVPSLDHSVP